MWLEQNQIDQIIQLVRDAGEQAKRYYELSDIKVEYKTDKSPVTLADQQLSNLITAELKRIAPHIPVITEEEDDDINLKILRTGDTYWLIDPIDGTRSFIRKRGDFTINVALILDGEPIFGIIYQPLKDILYYTGSDNKAYKEAQGVKSIIQVNKNVDPKQGLNIVVPTRHLSEEAQSFYASLNIKSSDQVSSSLKFCLVAEGKYDLYANFTRLSIWDVAAGHAILLKAGGVIHNKDGSVLKYNKESLRNPRFVAFSRSMGEDYIKEKLMMLKKTG